MNTNNMVLLDKRKISLNQNIELNNSGNGVIFNGKLGVGVLNEQDIFKNTKGSLKTIKVNQVNTHFFENKNQFGKFVKESQKKSHKKAKDNIIVRIVSNVDEKRSKPLAGLYTSIVSNIIDGLNEGYRFKIKLSGVGYRASIIDLPKTNEDINKVNLEEKQKEKENSKPTKAILFKLGYSHQISVAIPNDLLVVSIKPTILSVIGSDLEKLTQFLHDIRALRKPEPYKGKGIILQNEIIRRKESKKK